jgi:hypothetical protein
MWLALATVIRVIMFTVEAIIDHCMTVRHDFFLQYNGIYAGGGIATGTNSSNLQKYSNRNSKCKLRTQIKTRR